MFIKRIDGRGRVFIPLEIRNVLGIGKEYTYEIYEQGGEVHIKRLGCIFCGALETTRKHKGLPVCADCLEDISQNRE